MPRLPRAARTLTFALALALVPVIAPAETMVTEAGDPVMAAAIETARSHLARVFDVGFQEGGAAHPALTLKVAFPIEDGEEIIWVAEAARAGADMSGKLANDPLHLPGLSAGDTVTFTEDMIADWGIVGAARQAVRPLHHPGADRDHARRPGRPDPRPAERRPAARGLALTSLASSPPGPRLRALRVRKSWAKPGFFPCGPPHDCLFHASPKDAGVAQG